MPYISLYLSLEVSTSRDVYCPFTDLLIVVISGIPATDLMVRPSVGTNEEHSVTGIHVSHVSTIRFAPAI